MILTSKNACVAKPVTTLEQDGQFVTYHYVSLTNPKQTLCQILLILRYVVLSSSCNFSRGLEFFSAPDSVKSLYRDLGLTIGLIRTDPCDYLDVSRCYVAGKTTKRTVKEFDGGTGGEGYRPKGYRLNPFSLFQSSASVAFASAAPGWFALSCSDFSRALRASGLFSFLYCAMP